MNVSITVPPHTPEIYKVDLQALVANYLRQHGVTTPCVTVTEATSDNVEDYLINPLFMHEAPVYDTPSVVRAAALATEGGQMALVADEIPVGDPVSSEPSRTSLDMQAPITELPPG